MGLQLERVHVDHDLPVLAAVRRRHRRAGNTRDLVANLELQIIVQLRLVQPFALNGQQAHGQAGGVHLQHDGRQSSLRQSISQPVVPLVSRTRYTLFWPSGSSRTMAQSGL